MNPNQTTESVSRPPAICCPQCGQICEYVEQGQNYPCERCGVLWRWYCRSGNVEDIEIKPIKR